MRFSLLQHLSKWGEISVNGKHLCWVQGNSYLGCVGHAFYNVVLSMLSLPHNSFGINNTPEYHQIKQQFVCSSFDFMSNVYMDGVICSISVTISQLLIECSYNLVSVDGFVYWYCDEFPSKVFTSHFIAQVELLERFTDPGPSRSDKPCT